MMSEIEFLDSGRNSQWAQVARQQDESFLREGGGPGVTNIYAAVAGNSSRSANIH